VSGPELITLGCRLNIAESEAMRALMPHADDLVIVNSCAVTAEAVRQTGKAIRQARRARPDARIVVTGCAAEIEPERFAAMAEVDAVVGNRVKLEALSYATSSRRKPGSLDAGATPGPPVGTGAPLFQPIPAFAGMTNKHSHVRAFVEVQNGCRAAARAVRRRRGW